MDSWLRIYVLMMMLGVIVVVDLKIIPAVTRISVLQKSKMNGELHDFLVLSLGVLKVLMLQ